MPLKEFQIVPRQRIRVMQADRLGGEPSTRGALAGTQARGRSGSQRRGQAVAGFLERRPSYVSSALKYRRGLRVSASPFELHSEQPERLNLVPFGQSILRCLVTLSR
jgi:hypothetical protein